MTDAPRTPPAPAPDPRGDLPRGPEDTPSPDPEPRTHRFVLLLTFVAGLFLGGGVIAAVMWDDAEDTASDVATGAPPAATSGPGSRVVLVPSSCVQGLDQAARSLETLREGLAALRELDAARVQESLDDLQNDPQVTQLAEECRRAAAEAEILDTVPSS